MVARSRGIEDLGSEGCGNVGGREKDPKEGKGALERESKGGTDENIKPPSSLAGRFTQILSVGIGGSALGPLKVVMSAFDPELSERHYKKALSGLKTLEEDLIAGDDMNDIVPLPAGDEHQNPQNSFLKGQFSIRHFVWSPNSSRHINKGVVKPSCVLPLTEENVEKVLDEVRPSLMADGGNVALHEIDGLVCYYL
ncbi:hypothetical protein Syun_022829 [Stephania yunnanensis]|uniref:Uncharacterized protein n=1 Tax=Stephania yunnanensis TaxID=152371 RepID=A0AAP0FEF2_9MAGN